MKFLAARIFDPPTIAPPACVLPKLWMRIASRCSNVIPSPTLRKGKLKSSKDAFNQPISLHLWMR
jgi:hypothetical protein